MICGFCKINEEKNKKRNICASCYAKDWRKNNPEKIRAYLDRTYERRKEVNRKYIHSPKFKEGLKLRREEELVRAKTRQKYPLKGNKCVKCGKNAKHRHHTTEPLETDKFLFLCRKCHLKEHGKKTHKIKCVFQNKTEEVKEE